MIAALVQVFITVWKNRLELPAFGSASSTTIKMDRAKTKWAKELTH
jgi:hypothetical protein